MKRLSNQQSVFQSHILNGNKDVMSMLDTPPSGHIQSRLDVYREGYYLRLIEVIQTDFETLCDILGEEAFTALARDYIASHTSRSFTLDNYSCDFPLFVKDKLSLLHYEIAHFEWMLAEIRMIKPAPSIDEQVLKSIEPEAWGRLCFTVQKTAAVYAYQYQILQFYENREKENIESSSDILIWQKDNQPFYLDLSAPKKKLFFLLREGDDFITLCEELCDIMSEQQVPGFVSETLREFVHDELITGFYLN